MYDSEKGKEEKDSKKVAILIDGNNFYNNLKSLKLHNLPDFKYKEFAEFLSKEREITIKNYYKGVIRKELNNTKSQEMVSAQQRLFASLESQGWVVEKGKMSKYHDDARCGGFYLTKEEIKNRFDLGKIGEKISSNYKNCYEPMIILTPDLPFWDKFNKETKEEELTLLQDGIYVVTNKWREKGVDVKIAIDMITLAYQEMYDTVILISNDSDLLPAVKAVKNFGKEVEYIGFEEKYSISLLKESNKKTLLKKEELEAFLPNILI